MANTIDKDHERRIDYEIIVDCYDEYEQAMGWIIYLSENLNCPFQARYIPSGETVEVLKLVNSEDDEELEYFQAKVEVKMGDEVSEVDLEDIKSINADTPTEQAIEDWRYWKTH